MFSVLQFTIGYSLNHRKQQVRVRHYHCGNTSLVVIISYDLSQFITKSYCLMLISHAGNQYQVD